MNVIFLDIDGVLNCKETKTRCPRGYYFVDDIFLERLKRIVEATDAKIVFSSDWRLLKGEEDGHQDYDALVEELAKFGMSVEDHTPNMYYRRSKEIQAWLQDHPEVSGFVILDDMYFSEPLSVHQVLTDFYDGGLKEEHVDKAIELMKLPVRPEDRGSSPQEG